MQRIHQVTLPKDEISYKSTSLINTAFAPSNHCCPFILRIQATWLENSSQRRMNRTEKELENKLKQLTRKQDRTNSSAMKYKEASDVNKLQKIEQMKSTGNEKSVNTRAHISPWPRINLEVSTPLISVWWEGISHFLAYAEENVLQLEM